MLAFIIWNLVSLFFVLLSIWCFRTKKPVTFWNVQDPIKVNDMKKYNRCVGFLWLGFAFVMFLLSIPLLFTGQNSPYVAITIPGTMFACIGAMTVYVFIEKKYRIK